MCPLEVWFRVISRPEVTLHCTTDMLRKLPVEKQNRAPRILKTLPSPMFISGCELYVCSTKAFAGGRENRLNHVPSTQVESIKAQCYDIGHTTGMSGWQAGLDAANNAQQQDIQEEQHVLTLRQYCNQMYSWAATWPCNEILWPSFLWNS